MFILLTIRKKNRIFVYRFNTICLNITEVKKKLEILFGLSDFIVQYFIEFQLFDFSNIQLLFRYVLFYHTYCGY